MTLETFLSLPPGQIGQILEDVYEWATERPNFDTTFLEALLVAFDKWNDLTERQRTAVYNICIKFENGVLDKYESTPANNRTSFVV